MFYFLEKLETSTSSQYFNEDLYKNLEELTLESSQSSDPTRSETTMGLLHFPVNSSNHDASVGTCVASSSSNGSSHSSTSSGSHSSHSSHRSNGSDGSGCSSRPSSHRTHEEDIYEDLCYVSLRTPNSNTAECSSKSALALEKRDYCLKELLETERNYVDVLVMIQSFFMRPLKSCMRPDDRAAVFSQIPTLLQLHEAFLDELIEACKSTGSAIQQRIASCFIRWKDRFILYGDYCANLPKAQALIDQLCSKNEFLNTKIEQYEVKS